MFDTVCILSYVLTEYYVAYSSYDIELEMISCQLLICYSYNCFYPTKIIRI